MEFTIKLHTTKLGRPFVCIEWSQVIIKKKIVFLFLKINNSKKDCSRLILSKASSADPDELSHNAACRLGLLCLPKYLLWGFWSIKGGC